MRWVRVLVAAMLAAGLGLWVCLPRASAAVLDGGEVLLGGSASGTVKRGDTVVYRVVLPVDGPLAVHYTPSVVGVLGLEVRAGTADGAVVGSIRNDAPAKIVYLPWLTAGTYCLVLPHDNGSLNDVRYTVSTSSELAVTPLTNPALLSPGGSALVYALPHEAAGPLTVSIRKAENVTTAAYLFGQSITGEPLAADAGQYGHLLALADAPAGTYYLVLVTVTAGGARSCEITVGGEATPLPLGVPTAGTLDYPTQIRLYRTEATAGRHLYISLLKATAWPSYIQVRQGAPDGPVVAEIARGGYSGPAKDDPWFDIAEPVTGPYFIRVEQFDRAATYNPIPAFSLCATQELPTLGDTPLGVDLPTTNSVRWFRLPVVNGQPLYAFADHNTDKSLRLTIIRTSLAGYAATSATGQGDQLAYLAKTYEPDYFARITTSTATHVELTGGVHLPTVTAEIPQSGEVTNAYDLHWYEAPVSANEEAILLVDKASAFGTGVPWQFTSPINAPAATSTETGDMSAVVTPTAAATYFIRVAGEPGRFTVRALRACPELTLGTPANAAPAHAGDERWFEVSSTPDQPLYLIADRTTGGEVAVDVYAGPLSGTPIALGGTESRYAYCAPGAAAVRSRIRVRAATTGFVADPGMRLEARTTLAPLSVGKTLTGTLAGPQQRKFYGLTMPPGSPLALQCSVPMTVEEPAIGSSLPIGTRAAVAGLGQPAVLVVGPGTGAYSVAASTDIAGAGVLYYSTPDLEARVDLARTTVGHVKFRAGSNTYLGGDGSDAPALHLPEGEEYAAGWALETATCDAEGLQLVWRHAAGQATKALLLRASATRAEFACRLETPKPMVLRNAITLAEAAGAGFTYAVPNGPVASNPYTQATAQALFPTTAGQFVAPSEPWAACWNSGVDEVFGVTLPGEATLNLASDGGATVARVRAPAGRTTTTCWLSRPKVEPPYQPIKMVASKPGLCVSHEPEMRLVPPESPIVVAVTVYNSGLAPASNTSLVVTLPVGVAYVEGSASNSGVYDAGARTLTWPLGPPAAGSSAKRTYSITVASAAPLQTPLTLSAVARADGVQPALTVAEVVPSAPGITGVSPTTAGNAGPLTVTLTGSCFAPGASVSLAQAGQVLPASAVRVAPGYASLQALVDVTGRSGLWDAVVTNPGGEQAVFPNAVSLTAGGRGEFWCDMTAPTALKQSVWGSLSVSYSNRGSADDVGRVLLVYVPTAVYESGTLRDEAGRALASAEQPGSLPGPLLLWMPRTGPGETHQLALAVKPLVARALAQYGECTMLTCALPREQLGPLLGDAAIAAFGVPVANRPATQAAAEAGVAAALPAWTDYATVPLWSAAKETVARMKADASLKGFVLTGEADAMGLLLDKAVAVLKAGGTKYPPLVLRKEYKPSVTAAGPSHEMTGPLGTMGTGYTGTEETYVYTATARAGTGSVAVRTVRITDTLDSNLDRSTVALRELRIGDLRVPLVGTTFPYHGYLDLRPGVKSIAEITIGYDPGTGMLTWDVMGHDPLSWNATTLLLPADAANGAKHELAVCFSVRPKAALGSGLTIANKAMVTLDGGVSAQTNERLNTIDAGPPSSEVSALPVVQEDADFTVRWTGRDEALGSGMACYSVYVRDNDGPYTLWKSRVTSTSAVYTGQMGHTYGFYTIAEDMVGHVEAPPTQADAAIKIGRDVALARGLRMVCVPLIPEQTDPKQLLGFAEGRWARYLPGTGYVKYSADPERLTWLDPPAQVPGRGYWGYWLEDKVIDPAGTPLPPVDSYALPLVDGWNLLGNPWTKTVGWDAAAVKVSLDGVTKTLAEATEAGWVDDIAWRWTPSAANPETGKYEMIADASITGAVHELAPWRGFWLRAYRPCALILPSPVAPAPVTAARRSTRIRQDGWQVQLTVRSGDAEDVCNWFGVATRPWNALSPPPPPGNWVDLAFAGGRVADLKPSDNVPWRFTVTAPTPGAEVSLAWPDLTALPPGTSLTLVDETTGVRRDLRTATGYTFTAPADGLAAPFHIEVAARAPLAMLGVTATPTRTPGSLAVTCRLSRGATVTAEVRTLTGVILRRLDGGRGETSTLLWDGRDTAGRAVRGTVLVLVTATDEQGQTVRGMTIGAGR